MTTFIALLRGINVGGHKLVKMAELKRTFEALGFSRVQTYIQSGNVVFEAAEDEASLRRRIEQAIEAAFGFAVPTVLRTAQALEAIVADCPFPVDRLAEGEELYVALLAEAPAQAGIDKLLASRSDTDECRLAGREVYLLLRNGARETIFTNNFLEKKLGVPVTTRNWQTINKLVEMGKEARG
ncbi:MAG TPA: DUF1697 domain-containing protein [Symbiobacteriaceae bacterium]|nr:DUF1697 domain-containing protein [Symbiobacteriaceae bacterium]